MGLPRDLGGLESEPDELISVIEELSRHDASAGWSVLIGNTSAFLAWLEPAAARSVVELTARPVVAGSMAPLGRGELTDDGASYRLTGRWPFASGCAHADWMMAGFIVTEGGRPKLTPGGGPQMRVAFLPAADVAIEDTWYAAGLAGTGSNDISITNALVPADRTAVPYRDPSNQPGPLYRLSPYNVLMVFFAGFPLGVARRALDELVRLAAGKRRTSAQEVLLEDPLVSTELVADEAMLHAAGQGVRARAAEVWETLGSGRDLTERQRAGLAAATIHAFDVGRDIATRAFHAAGAAALAEESPLQRCLRDMHAAGQHIAFSSDARERLSRTWLGLPVGPAIFAV